MQDELNDTSITSDGTTNSLAPSSISFLDFRSKVRPREIADGPSKVELYSGDEDFFQDPRNCASLIKWSSLNNIYPILGAYGGPTFIYPTKYCSVIGTSKGVIVIFSAKQLLLNTLIPQNKADATDNNYLRSPVSHIVASADGTHLAASYQSGDVFIWNLNAVEGEARITGARTITNPLKAILHVTRHRGSVINGLGFVASRHTALIISDNAGHIMYHNGFRSRLWSLTYSSERIIEIGPGVKLLNSEVAPFQKNSTLTHLVAILTSSDVAVISTNPHLNTLFIEKLPSRSTSNSLTNSCLSWYRDASRVAYSLNNKTGVFVFGDSLSFTSPEKMHWEANEPILSLQWVNDRLLGVLTTSHQFLVVDILCNFKSVMELDLLPHDLLIPPDKHFAIRDNHLYLLSHYNFKVGKFITWLDIMLNRVQKGDYIGALTFFRSLLRPDLPIASLIKLEREQRKKEEQLRRPFYNLSLAALRFVLGQSAVEYNEVYTLFSMVLQIIGMFQDADMRRSYTNSFLEQSLDFFGDSNKDILFEVLINHVLEGLLVTLPPLIFKTMLKHYADIRRTSIVEELIMTLDPRMLDIDLAVRLCKEYSLFDALIYIWNDILGDYLTPFVDAIRKISQVSENCTLFTNFRREDMVKIYDYLTFILTGRRYSKADSITPNDLQAQVKNTLYNIIFSGACIKWPMSGSQKLYTKAEPMDEPAYPYFKLLLEYNPSRFLSSLNEAFEDSFLNEGRLVSGSDLQGMLVSRQNIIHIMLDTLRSGLAVGSTQKALLAIFVAGNAAKYPQFVRLSNHDLSDVVDALCQSPQPELRCDLQRALESLLTAYTPSDIDKLVLQLKEKGFKRVLFTIYLKIRRYVDLLSLAVESNDTKSDFGEDLSSIVKLVLTKTKADPVSHASIIDIIKRNFSSLVEKLEPRVAALKFEDYDSEIHDFVTTLHDQTFQQKYLEKLSALPSAQNLSIELKRLYVELTIRNSSREDLSSWLHRIDFKYLDADIVLSLLLAKEHFEGASIIHMRLQKYTAAVQDLLHCLREWFRQDCQPYEVLDGYLASAIDASNASLDDKQSNWTKLLACMIEQYGDQKTGSKLRESCKKALEKLFVKLAISDSSTRSEKFGGFWSILTGVLEHQDVILRRAQDLKQLLVDIFKAYDIEEHISRIVLKIMEDSSSGITWHYNNCLQGGHSICNEECDVCGRKVWGKGLDQEIFQVWELRIRDPLNDKGTKGSSIVLFFCHHGFHRRCLENLGQRQGSYFCLVCDRNKK